MFTAPQGLKWNGCWSSLHTNFYCFLQCSSCESRNNEPAVVKNDVAVASTPARSSTDAIENVDVMDVTSAASSTKIQSVDIPDLDDTFDYDPKSTAATECASEVKPPGGSSVRRNDVTSVANVDENTYTPRATRLRACAGLKNTLFFSPVAMHTRRVTQKVNYTEDTEDNNGGHDAEFENVVSMVLNLFLCFHLFLHSDFNFFLNIE